MVKAGAHLPRIGAGSGPAGDRRAGSGPGTRARRLRRHDGLMPVNHLSEVERVERRLASAMARAGFESLTWGEGLAAVTGNALSDFLWYQLPTKWLCDLDEKQQVAVALGELFQCWGRSRYAGMCASAETAGILVVYENDGGSAGFGTYRSALSASGLQPPDLPGVLEWRSVIGSDEAGAYASASPALEHAIDNGELRPGWPS